MKGAADAALVIFAKAPVPGQVKTRLCPPLSPDEAATLHGSFVLDVLEGSRPARMRGRPAFDRLLFCEPSPELAYFKILEARHDVRLFPQAGEDLGARMQQAFLTVFGLGYRRVLLVGTDLPTLTPKTYTDALRALEAHDVVLGPALDGGYYLIGLSQPRPALFEDIAWSTAEVLRVTQTRADALGLRVALLPACRDVDRLEDLQALLEDCRSGRKGETVVSKRTAGVLETLAKRHRLRGAHREGP